MFCRKGSQVDFPFSNAYVVIGAGAILWFVIASLPGSDPARRRKTMGMRFCNFVSWVSIAIILLGIYGGIAGPVRLGFFTVQRFAERGAAAKSNAKDLRYARTNLRISMRPANGWNGASTKALQCTVHNAGREKVAYVYLRFSCEPGHSPAFYDMKVKGPFKSGRKRKANISPPNGVLRSYFTGSGKVLSTQIVGAAL